MLNRRGFLGLIGAAIFGRKLLAAPVVTEAVGITIRFQSRYDALGYHFNRIDAFYGLGQPVPGKYSVRIEG